MKKAQWTYSGDRTTYEGEIIDEKTNEEGQKMYKVAYNGIERWLYGYRVEVVEG